MVFSNGNDEEIKEDEGMDSEGKYESWDEHREGHEGLETAAYEIWGKSDRIA
jgi:hypothetical protein